MHPTFLHPHQLIISVDPDTPQATGHQTDDGGKCTVHISWITPDNIAISDIKDHVIYIDGVNVLNESNTTDTLLSVSYRVRGCAPHNISVGIVNRCGRMGPPSPDVTVSPQPIICEDSVCEVDTDNCKCNQAYDIYYCDFHTLDNPVQIQLQLFWKSH